MCEIFVFLYTGASAGSNNKTSKPRSEHVPGIPWAGACTSVLLLYPVSLAQQIKTWTSFKFSSLGLDSYP